MENPLLVSRTFIGHAVIRQAFWSFLSECGSAAPGRLAFNPPAAPPPRQGTGWPQSGPERLAGKSSAARPDWPPPPENYTSPPRGLALANRPGCVRSDLSAVGKTSPAPPPI